MREAGIKSWSRFSNFKTLHIDFAQDLEGGAEADVDNAAENFGVEAEVIDEEHFVVLRARMNVNVVDTGFKVHSMSENLQQFVAMFAR